ncbi:MAG: hypothetical protein M1138_06340 [Candidatus Thermoplasmatota archaeon]|nr:hypothetical protein [Candidatus Thermoplasmatota archaeon]
MKETNNKIIGAGNVYLSGLLSASAIIEAFSGRGVLGLVLAAVAFVTIAQGLYFIKKQEF